MFKNKTRFIINFLIRALVGITLIFFINEFLLTKEIEPEVGINLFNFMITGVFGVPGVALLYGIGFY